MIEIIMDLICYIALFMASIIILSVAMQAAIILMVILIGFSYIGFLWIIQYIKPRRGD